MTAIGFLALAALGAVVRWQAGRLNTAAWASGTLIVNVVASFGAGLLHAQSETAITLVGVAALGSLSTFSTVVREVVEAAERPGGTRRAVGYGSTTLTTCVAAAWLGVALG